MDILVATYGMLRQLAVQILRALRRLHNIPMKLHSVKGAYIYRA